MDEKQLPDIASFDIVLESDTVALKFPMDDTSVRLSHIQTGNFIQQEIHPSKTNLLTHFAEYHGWQWQQCNQVGTWELSENARIIDIGSGLAVLDMIMARRRSDLRFWLIDRGIDEYQTDLTVPHGVDHPYYNSWITVEQQIKLNDLDRKRFVLQPPDGPWPCEVDLIISTWCWCWHLPLETYLDRVIDSLAVGGRLCVDIRYQHFDYIAGELSKHLKSDPRIVSYQGRPWIKDSTPCGYRCCWIRQ